MIKYTEEEILIMLKDEQKTNEFLLDLDGEDIKRLLIYVNSKVRDIPVEQNSIFRGNMRAGELISPSNDIQDRYFGKLAESLRNIKGNRNRATMLHYMINELHLFEDGNGRTGRCIFEMFTNPNFNFENNDNFSHKDVGYKGTSEFEKDSGVKDYSEAINYPSYLVYKALCESGIITKVDNCIYCATIPQSGVDGVDYHNLILIADTVKEHLTEKQLEDIGLALCDNNEILSVSGLTMMAMQENKSGKIKATKFDEMSEYSISDYVIAIDEDESKETFEGWTKEDYLKATRMSNIIKESMLDAMLDIFEQPENFMLDSSITIADLLSHNLGDDDKYPMEIIMELYQHCDVNLDGTRTQSNIKTIKDFMRQGNFLQSAIETTEQQTRIGEINLESKKIKTIQHDKIQQLDTEKLDSQEL